LKKGIERRQKKEISIDCRETPDLFPILAVLGCYTNKIMRLYNVQNLRKKESNRISVMARELKKMGAKLEEKEDQLILKENTKLTGANLNHENDHRVAMALIVAAMFAESKSQISNINIINDSYPTFLEDLQKLGGNFKLK
jgi:5-enolpyruvylshikimate-3-phosphate synthase